MRDCTPFETRLADQTNRLWLAVLCLLAIVAGASGEDWPQFLGPRRDGTSSETGLLEALTDAQPNVLWRREVGGGFSGPVIFGERLFLFHQVGGDEVVECLDAATGAARWRAAYPSAFAGGLFRDPGPRATPSVVADRVYTFGGGAVLQCLDAQSGTVVWRRQLAEETPIPESFFGAASSPLVENKLLLVNVGAPAGSGIVAFDRDTGKTVWKSADDEAGYASPVVAEVGGKRLVYVFARTGLHAVDPQTGQEQFFFRFRARIHASVNAATPLAIGDKLFLSASYNTGAALLHVTTEGYQTIWNRIGALDAHYNTPVHVAGFLYGIDGRQEEGARLRCIELASGQPRWTVERYGCASIIVADGKLWLIGEKGTLELARVEPREFRSLGRQSIVKGVVRAHAALANGRLYARSAAELVCLDIRKRQ